MESIYHLFVYGSLRSGFRNPAYQYIADYFTLEGEAVVQGKFYDKGEYPVAVSANDNTYITGELYLAKNKEAFDWAIAQLDDYEGLNVEPGEKAWYKREQATVYINKQPFVSWIYWYNDSVANMEEIVTGDIMKYLQEKNKP
ncbi:MAG: gamma-glutamylcyclotransferase family protein [Bacteroidota bacterium]